MYMIWDNMTFQPDPYNNWPAFLEVMIVFKVDDKSKVTMRDMG